MALVTVLNVLILLYANFSPENLITLQKNSSLKMPKSVRTPRLTSENVLLYKKCINYGKIKKDSNFQNDIVNSFFRAAL